MEGLDEAWDTARFVEMWIGEIRKWKSRTYMCILNRNSSGLWSVSKKQKSGLTRMENWRVTGVSRRMSREFLAFYGWGMLGRSKLHAPTEFGLSIGSNLLSILSKYGDLIKAHSMDHFWSRADWTVDWQINHHKVWHYLTLLRNESLIFQIYVFLGSPSAFFTLGGMSHYKVASFI